MRARMNRQMDKQRMNEWMKSESCFPLRGTLCMLYNLQNLVCPLVIRTCHHPDEVPLDKVLWSIPIHCSWLRFANTLGWVLVPGGPKDKDVTEQDFPSVSGVQQLLSFWWSHIHYCCVDTFLLNPRYIPGDSSSIAVCGLGESVLGKPVSGPNL